MSYFLANNILKTGAEQTITGEEVVHIAQARRIKIGEHINLQGPDHRRFNTEVIAADRHAERGSLGRSASRRAITVKILEEISTPPEPKLKVILFQALIHEQALDYILQKSTELGAATIVIFPSENTPTQFHGERLIHKIERWQKIALEAAKQCDRVQTPELQFAVDFEEAVERAKKVEKILVFDQRGHPFDLTSDHPKPLLEKEGKSPTISSPFEGEVGRGRSIGIFIGPEGGFTPEELTTLRALPNATAVRMGPRILRTETAATAAIAIVQTLFGDMA